MDYIDELVEKLIISSPTRKGIFILASKIQYEANFMI
jgi:hypothetical protein